MSALGRWLANDVFRALLIERRKVTLDGEVPVPDGVFGLEANAVGEAPTRSAHIRQLDRLPSAAISKAVSLVP